MAPTRRRDARRDATRSNASPPLDPDDARRVARLRRYAHLLDSSVRVPGTTWRLGIDSIVGLVPVVGDVIGAGLSLGLVLAAHRSAVPRSVTRRMLANIAFEGLVGCIPVVGDAFDVVFRANERNVALLERELARRSTAGEN